MPELVRKNSSLLLAITGICALIYLVSWQNLCFQANNPQLQMSQDIAYQLSQGKDPSTLMPPQTIDIAKNLSPFVIVFDNTGKAIATNANVQGDIPPIPPEVLQAAGFEGQNIVTWQPREDIRAKVVVTGYSGNSAGYVLVGRSLQEFDKQQQQLMLTVGIGWLVIIAVSLFAPFMRFKINIKEGLRKIKF